ncbi:MAG: MCE family protein [Acidobacteria bacterium]|nr:MCE family protein [Acidobacteriota bacterium]
MTPAAKIGLFVLMGLIVLGIFILKIEDIPIGERGDRLTVRAEFQTVSGIDRKADVRIAGVRVGKVKDVELAGGQALLTLSLDPSVELHRGASVRVSSLGMLGDKFVEVVPGDPNAPLLPPGTVLHGTSPPSFDDVLKVATDIGADVKQVTLALRESIGGQVGAEKLTEIVDNIDELTATLKVLIQQNQGNVNATMENFKDFSTTLKVELPRIAEKMNRLADSLQGVVNEDRGDLHASLANIRDLSGRLRTSADNLNAITTKIAKGEGSIGKLVNDETTVDNLNDTLTSIKDGVHTIEDRLKMKRFRLDLGFSGESLGRVGESRGVFGVDIWETGTRRFFRVEGVHAPYGRRRVTTEDVTYFYPDGNEASFTRQTIKTDDRFTFNLQIGYRLFPKTIVRAGVFEGQGGIGIDQGFNLASHPAQLILEAYDWDRPEKNAPHLRLQGRFFVTQNIFLSAGWDDPAFSERQSYTLGAGIRWGDEGIKELLGLAGAAF